MDHRFDFLVHVFYFHIHRSDHSIESELNLSNQRYEEEKNKKIIWLLLDANIHH